MQYRKLGNTDLYLSEIGLGAEWLERHTREEVIEVIRECECSGINVLDCWMAEPNVRTNIGLALAGRRDKWILQGHLGSTQQRGQYVRTRDMAYVPAAFEDFLVRMQTDYVDIGLINYVDEPRDLDEIMNGEFIKYVRRLKASGVIRAVGMSTHNPIIARAVAESGEFDMMMFSINPAFDMRPPNEDIMDLLDGRYDPALSGVDPQRAALYSLCESRGVGITVMKAYAGGRLFDPALSPFGVAMTPVQCLHYALTRPAVASVMVGAETPEQVRAAVAYETATAEERDFSSVLAHAPAHAHPQGQCTYCGHCAPCPRGIDIAMVNKFHDLALMQQEPAESIRAHYASLSAHASDCIGCGGCERRCPFGVSVVEKMRKTKELFGR